MQPSLVRRNAGGHNGLKTRGRETKPEKQMDSDKDSLRAQRLHLLPEPQRGSPSAYCLIHSEPPIPIPFLITSSPRAQAEISCWTKVQAYHKKFSPQFGQRLSLYWIRGQASCQKLKPQRPEDRGGNRNQRTKYPSNENKLRNQHQDL